MFVFACVSFHLITLDLPGYIVRQLHARNCRERLPIGAVHQGRTPTVTSEWSRFQMASRSRHYNVARPFPYLLSSLKQADAVRQTQPHYFIQELQYVSF